MPNTKPTPTGADWGWFALTMILALAVAVIGEPRPVALVVAGVAAITATFRIVQVMDR